MNFTTPIPLAPSNKKIDHHKTILLLGSCFSENIGERLSRAKFAQTSSPLGISFNPVSIAKSVELFLGDAMFQEDELFLNGELYHHFQCHSSLSNPHKAEALSGMNDRLTEARGVIAQMDTLVITFGSAWAYEHQEVGIVANCHKLPQQDFEKVLLSTNRIVEVWTNVIEKLLAVNTDLQIIFTVSPVRHWKDGAVENQRSKSHLISAVHELVDKFECCEYFPAYEIVMDELRDYRFYADDLLHPSKQAVAVIWDRFAKTYFTDETQALTSKLESLSKALEHEPFHPVLESYRKFVEKQVETIGELANAYPFLDLGAAEELMRGKLESMRSD